MKHTPYAQAQHTGQKRSFRRFVKRMFASLFPCPACQCQEELQQVLAKLQDVEDSIEIIAMEIARQIKLR